MSRAMQFSRDLDAAFQKKVIAQCVEFHKKVTLAAWRDITATARFAGGAHGSPFWSGRFRASNQISIGKPDFNTEPAKKNERWPHPVKNPYKSRTPAEGVAALQGLKPFDKVFISNGLPYSRRIEYQGWSAQVPNGVYRVTAERMRSRFENVTVEVLSRGVD